MLSKCIYGVSKVLGLLLVLTALAARAWASDDFGGGPVPEIDPSSMISAVTLLFGGLLLLRGKRPR
jgi:hypothetical protein